MERLLYIIYTTDTADVSDTAIQYAIRYIVSDVSTTPLSGRLAVSSRAVAAASAVARTRGPVCL
eukprot:344750-Prymnesium_polylepis.1